MLLEKQKALTHHNQVDVFHSLVLTEKAHALQEFANDFVFGGQHGVVDVNRIENDLDFGLKQTRIQLKNTKVARDI